MIDQLLALYSNDRFTRAFLYFGILFFSLTYGVINDLVLNRSTEEVSREVAALTAILATGLPVLYANRQRKRADSALHLRVRPTRYLAGFQPSYQAYLDGSIAVAHRRLAALEQELMNLREQFAVEYAYQHEPRKLESGKPFVIEHEYQIGRILSIGAWGALVLAALAESLLFKAVLAVPPWISVALSAGVTLSQFGLFRAMLAAVTAYSGRPSRKLSRTAAGSSAISLLLLTGVALLRSVPYRSEGLSATVFALLSFALPFSAAAVSAAAQPYLWSHRFVALLEKKQRELQVLEYEFQTLTAFDRELKRRESEPHVPVVPGNT